jgi:hypothetical protein
MTAVGKVDKKVLKASFRAGRERLVIQRAAAGHGVRTRFRLWPLVARRPT